MTIHELVDHLTAQAAEVERTSLAKDRHRRVVINTINGALDWASKRSPQPPQGEPRGQEEAAT